MSTVANLRAQQLSLQNQLLLLKSSTNTAAFAGASQKHLEKQLETVSSDLQTAKSDEMKTGPVTDAQTVASTKAADTKSIPSPEPAVIQKRYDTYIPEQLNGRF